MINLDKLNRTYSVLLGDYVNENFKELKQGSTISFVNIPDEIKEKHIIYTNIR